jgi:hypothetical protein
MHNKKNNSDTPHYSESYLIEKERIKTRRTRNRYIFFGVIILAALFALYLIVGKGGKGGVDISLTGGTFKFSVDKPVVEQAKTETKTFKTPKGKKIEYTTGTVDKQVIHSFKEEKVSFYPNRFVGENLINEPAGFIISSTYPSTWNVQYDPAGLYDPMASINTLTASDGSNLRVGRISTQMYSNLDEFVNTSVDFLIQSGSIAEYPDISYADDGKTAFLVFTNPMSNGQSYMKIVQGKDYFYTVSANYNLDITDYNTQQDMISMVANFTLLE